MTRLRTFAVVLALAAVTLPGPLFTGPATAGVGDNKIRVIQHNTDMGGPASALAAAASWGDVDAITFQELCKSQLSEVRAAGYQVMWRKQIQASNCPPPPTGSGGRATRSPPLVGSARRRSRHSGPTAAAASSCSARTSRAPAWPDRGSAPPTWHWGTPTRPTAPRPAPRRPARSPPASVPGSPAVARSCSPATSTTSPSRRRSTLCTGCGATGRSERAAGSGKATRATTAPVAAKVCAGRWRSPPTRTRRASAGRSTTSSPATEASRQHKGMSKGLVDSATAGHWIVRGQVKFG